MAAVETTPAPRTPRRGARHTLLPLALLLMAACGGGDPDAAPDAAPPAETAAVAQPAADEAAQPAQPAPAQVVPGSPEDIARITQDSIQEAQLYRRRQASMESVESCIAKTRAIEQPQRTILENACKRSRGAQR